MTYPTIKYLKDKKVWTVWISLTYMLDCFDTKEEAEQFISEYNQGYGSL